MCLCVNLGLLKDSGQYSTLAPYNCKLLRQIGHKPSQHLLVLPSVQSA